MIGTLDWHPESDSFRIDEEVEFTQDACAIDGDDESGVACTPDWVPGDDWFGGKMREGCDTVAGVCETAVSLGAYEFYPCVNDPDCCCIGTEPEFEDIYACEFDSCMEDGFCDAFCPDGWPDPDCD